MRVARLAARLAALTPRTKRLLGTTVASYLARLASAGVMLLTIPMARRVLDAELFGLWMMLGSLLAFFAFADFGLGNGLMNRISVALHRGHHAEVSRMMVAGYFCTLVCGLLLCGSWIAWVVLNTDPLRFAGRIAPAHQTEAQWAFSTLVLLVALGLPIQITQKLQLAHQQGHWVGLAHLASALGTLVLLPLGLTLGWSLPVLLLCTLGLQVLVTGGFALVWLARYGQFGPLRHARLETSAITRLLRTGSLFFVLQLSAAFAFQSDAFVITQLMGTAAYGDYAAIQRLFLSMSALVGAALLGLWPAFAEALARGDVPWARKAFVRSLALGFVVMGTLCMAITLSTPWLSQHWLGMSSPPPMMLPVLLSVWAVLETLGQISGTLLNGAGIVRAQVFIAVLMSATAFAGKWLLVAEFGTWGAVLATIVAYSLITVPTVLWLLRRMFSGRAGIAPASALS